MSTYFFDFIVNGREEVDDVGVELGSRDQVQSAARRALLDVVSETPILPCAASVTVRDNRDGYVLQATLSLRAKWL